MSPERPRPIRRLLVPTAIGIVSSLVTMAAVSFAGFIPSFDDVPPTHPFSGEIELVAESCIAQGYNDGSFRPGQPVTRGAMAAFLARSAGRIGSTNETGGAFPTFGSATPGVYPTWSTVADGGIRLPDDGCSRTLKLDAQASVFTNAVPATACHSSLCNVEIGLFVGNTQVATSLSRLTTFESADAVSLTARHTTSQEVVSYSLRIRTLNVKADQVYASHRMVLATYFPLDTGLDVL